MHLDARHALWLADDRALVVADLHLGYAWAHRHGGQLMPLSVPDDTIERLARLAADYRAAEVVLLGDIVHRAVPVPALREQLVALAAQLSNVRLRWIAGNHDGRLRGLLEECGMRGVSLERELAMGPHLLAHGDDAGPLERLGAGRLIVGHEHPAIHLGDGVTTSLKCPCFLLSERVLVLPAFSRWAAGCNVRNGRYMSAIAQGARFTHAFAIMGGRILPVGL
jgi:DNA ligase-associated metallophosphoesterase